MCEWNAIDLHMHTVVGITGDGKELYQCNKNV